MDDRTGSPNSEPTLKRIQEYEITFKKYSEKKLQKVINDEGYNEDARQAARNMLRKKNERNHPGSVSR